MVEYSGSSEYLLHFGIKGMKWGVRRTPEQLGHIGKKKLAKIEKRKTKKTATHEKTLSVDQQNRETTKKTLDGLVEVKTKAIQGRQNNQAERLNSQFEIKSLQKKIDEKGFWTRGGVKRAKKTIETLTKRLGELDEMDSEHTRAIANSIATTNTLNNFLSQLDTIAAQNKNLYDKDMAKLEKKTAKVKKKYGVGGD